MSDTYNSSDDVIAYDFRDDVRALKARLQKLIGAELFAFTMKTGVTISDIDITFMDVTTADNEVHQSRVMRVDVTLKL